MNNNYTVAYDQVFKVKEFIEHSNESPSTLLYMRAWLLHWSMFVFFRQPRGLDALLDLYLHPVYLNTIQTACPWLLTYVAAAALSSKKKKSLIKELIKLQRQERDWNDCLVQFLDAIHVTFDLKTALKKWSDVETFFKQDYFLGGHVDALNENARLLVFETFLRVRQTLDLSLVSQMIQLDSNKTVAWVTQALQDTKLNAKLVEVDFLI